MAIPSITIFIDSENKSTECIFQVQEVTPAEYGVVISGLMKHIANLYCQRFQDTRESEVIADIQLGINAGIQQSEIIPIKFH